MQSVQLITWCADSDVHSKNRLPHHSMGPCGIFMFILATFWVTIWSANFGCVYKLGCTTSCSPQIESTSLGESLAELISFEPKSLWSRIHWIRLVVSIFLQSHFLFVCSFWQFLLPLLWTKGLSGPQAGGHSLTHREYVRPYSIGMQQNCLPEKKSTSVYDLGGESRRCTAAGAFWFSFT